MFDYYDSCGGMHQPVDFDFSDLMPELMGTAHVATPMDTQPKQEPPKQEASIQAPPGPSRRRAGGSKASNLRPNQIMMSQLQKQLGELVKEYNVVDAENQRLKNRLRVIEAVLPVREQQARLAQSAPRLVANKAAGSSEPTRQSLLDSASSSSYATSSPSIDVEETAASTGTGAQGSGAAGPSTTTSSGRCTAASGDRDLLESSRWKLQSEEKHSAVERQWLDSWHTWVREAALLVQAYDARPNEAYVKRVEEAFAKMKSVVVSLGLRHTELICNMRQMNMESGVEEVPPDSFWSLVAAGMRLSPSQVSDCRTALTLYRERMEVVMAERRGLAQQLASCMGALHLAEEEGRAGPCSMQRDRLTLKAEEVAAALDSNVAAEGHITMLARDLLNSTLFTKMQCARISVLSYPYFPDALALLSAAVAGVEKPGRSGGSNAASDRTDYAVHG